MTERRMSEAEMARAVARGVQEAKRRDELRKSMIGVCALLSIVLLFVAGGFVTAHFPDNSTASNVAAITAILLPWIVFWKLVR